MKIVFEDDNIYSVSPLNMANEIIDALAKRIDESSICIEERMSFALDVCKTIEFMEIWRKQNQSRIEKDFKAVYHEQ